MNTSYKEYLKSSSWKYMKNLAIKAAEGRCQLCNSDKKLEVHHRTYERIGEERIADLIVLCHNCHGRFHDKILSPDSFAKLKTKLERNNKKLETEKNHERIIVLLRENENLCSQLRTNDLLDKKETWKQGITKILINKNPHLRRRLKAVK